MPVPTTPYDSAQTALNDAIIFANDGAGPNGMQGNVLNPTSNPQVLPAFQERWRYLQQRLISAGVDTFTKDQVIFALPPTAVSNPRVNMILTYNGYFNGQVWTGPNVTAPQWSNAVTYTQGMTVSYNNTYYVALPNSGTNLNMEPDTNPNFWQQFTNLGPCLPADLIKPLECWECITGGQNWVPMRQVPDAVTTNVIQPYHGVWGFSNDRWVTPGASLTTDIRMKYLAMAPDIVSFESPLMVRGCSTALALLVLDQLSGGRGGSMQVTFKDRAEEAINQIINQTVRKQAYSQFVRAPFRSRGGSWRGRRSGL